MTVKPGLRVNRGHQKYTIRSGVHDFLLMFHSNHRPISHHFRDKRRFPLSLNFPTPVYLTRPMKWFLLKFGIGARRQKTAMLGLPDGPKGFKIYLVV